MPCRLPGWLCYAAVAHACAPYEYHDAEALANVTALFGAPYTIAATPAPFLSLDGRSLGFTASFATRCTRSAPQFTLSMDATPHKLGSVLIASREEAACDGPPGSMQHWTGHVVLTLPQGYDRQQQLLLAFPPGSEYELWQLSTPSLAPAGARQAGGALQRAPAKLRLYVHRAEPKVQNPNGPCSTLLEVAPNAGVEDVLALASARLGVKLVALRSEEQPDRELPALLDEASLVAFEGSPDPHHAQPPTMLRLYVHRAHPKVQNPNGPCSTLLEVASNVEIKDVVALASTRLGVTIVALRSEDEPEQELSGLFDGASLVALEALPAPHHAQPPAGLDLRAPLAQTDLPSRDELRSMPFAPKPISSVSEVPVLELRVIPDDAGFAAPAGGQVEHKTSSALSTIWPTACCAADRCDCARPRNATGAARAC